MNAAPLLALARRLVGERHAVVFFTTAHYRTRVEATGASFVPFAAEYDAHDLVVVNPARGMARCPDAPDVPRP